MSSRKFHALFVFGMMILAAMFTGGCGGSGGSDVSLVGQNTTPTPIVSPDPTPTPSPTPTPIISQDPTPSPTPSPVISPDPTPVISPDQTPTASSCTVDFDSDGGSEIASLILSRDEAIYEPDEPQKDGFTFMGWHDAEGRLFNFGVSIDRDILLTAEWAQTVSADDNEIAELTKPEYEAAEKISLDMGGPLSGAEVRYKTDGFALVSVSEVSEDTMLNAPGLIGHPVEISSFGGEVKEAMITFYYDPSALSVDANNLGIVWYDESNDILTLLSEDTTVDTVNNAVYVVTDHFSKYGVVDRQKWVEMWLKSLPAVRTGDIYYNVILAMDCSGSMDGDKMNKSIAAAKTLVDMLRDGDWATVIAFDYSSAVKVSTEITSAPSNSRETVKSRLDSLYAWGGTNINSALNTALNYNKSDSGFRTFVILLSDGQSSVYDSTLQKLRDNNMMVISVGLGSDVDSSLMQRIADYTGGSYLYADTATDVQEKFNEIVENDLGSSTDTDGDGIPDNAEKEGMRDQNGQHIKTDPNNADTDGDGISDDVEMGEYHKSSGYGDYDHFKRKSDPKVYTVKSNLARVWLSANNVGVDMKRVIDTKNKQITLAAFIHDERRGSIGDNKECLYSPAQNLKVEVSFPKNNYSSVGGIRVEALKRDDGSSAWYAFITLSYRNYPGRRDKTTWRITADNLAKHGTANERADFIEDEGYMLSLDDPVRDGNLATKLKAWRAVLEKEFIEKLCSDAQQGSSNADNNAELKQRKNNLLKHMKQYGGGSVPDEVCEAFALAVLDTYDPDGSKVEKYSKDMNELTKQLLNQIASSVKSGEKEVVAGGHLYRVKFTFMRMEGTEVDFAYVDRDGRSYATLVWTTSMDEMKEALAAYCAKLAELNKDVWNDFLVSYVEDALSEIGIEVKEGTVEKILGIAENTVRGLAGDKGAANKVVEELAGAAKDKLTSAEWWPFSENKFMKFVEKNFPKGDKIVKSAEKLKTLKEKYDSFKGAVDRYNFASLFGGGDGSDLKNTFEAFKTVYEELGKENLLDVSHPVISWPEGW